MFHYQAEAEGLVCLFPADLLIIDPHRTPLDVRPTDHYHEVQLWWLKIGL